MNDFSAYHAKIAEMVLKPKPDVKIECMDDILNVYKQQYPDVLRRLPLPKEIAEKWGVPIKDDIVGLKEYLKDHMAIRTFAMINEKEERICGEVIPPEEVAEKSKADPIEANVKVELLTNQTSSEHLLENPSDLANSRESSAPRTLVLEPQTSSNLPPSLNGEPNMTLSV
jgi:hypothetical protein